MSRQVSLAKSMIVGILILGVAALNPALAGKQEQEESWTEIKGKLAAAKKKNKKTVVNCNRKNASIQKEINKVRHNADKTIFIKGICDESVVIDTDNITLRGDRDLDDVVGGGLTEIRIVGARRVTINALELTGSGYGVLVTDGASADIYNSNIHDNQYDGVGVANGSFARIYFNTITNNGRPAPYYEAGIDVWAGSTARSAGNLVSENPYAAVEVGSQSYFRSGFFTTGIPDSADLDVFIQKGCLQGQDASSACGDPGTVAIDFYRNGVADFRNTEVTGSSEIAGLSNLDVRYSIFNGNIDGYGGSRIHLRNTVSGSGVISCFGTTFSSSFWACGDTLTP